MLLKWAAASMALALGGVNATTTTHVTEPCHRLETEDTVACGCREGFYAEIHGYDIPGAVCTSLDTIYNVEMTVSSSFVRAFDNSVRPGSMDDQCFIHKRPGFQTGEFIYVKDCTKREIHSAPEIFRWTYDETTHQVKNIAEQDTNPHCWAIANPDTRAKQSLQLQPCDSDDVSQKWVVDDVGKLVLESNPVVCVFWITKEGGRVWTAGCADFTFGVREAKLLPDRFNPTTEHTSCSEIQHLCNSGDENRLEHERFWQNNSGCMEKDGKAYCTCPMDYTIDTVNRDEYTCAEKETVVASVVAFQAYPVGDDRMLRMHSWSDYCMHHKGRSISSGEKVYAKQCQLDNPIFQWGYNPDTKQIVAEGDGTSASHCITVPTYNHKKKQSLVLQPCTSENEGQKFHYENGMLQVDGARDVCIFWVLREKTRVWSAGCSDYMLSEVASKPCLIGSQCNRQFPEINPCYDSPCKNEGTCKTTATYSDYTCEDCHSDYMGKNCDEIRPCLANPCGDAATECLDIVADPKIPIASPDYQRFTCVCPETHAGLQCEVEIPCTTNPCGENAFLCQNGLDNLSYECLCMFGFTGQHCDQPM